MTDRPIDPDLREIASYFDKGNAEVDHAQQRLAEAERNREFWRQMYSHCSANRPASLLLLIRESGDLVHRLTQARDPRAELIERLQKEAEARAGKAVSSFGRTFPERFRDSDVSSRFPIDSTSRHPHYTFAAGFVRLDIDERNHVAKIIPREGDEIKIGSDVDYIVERLSSELRRLFDRPLDRDAFVRSLYTAYIAVLRSEKLGEGEEVPLKRVSNRMGKNLNHFSADEFNVDLARLIGEGRVDIEGRRLHLNHTRNARQGMLLRGMEEGGYVGFISFKRDS